MFTTSKALSGFAASGVEAAKAFYGMTLGLETSLGPAGLMTLHLAGGTDLLVCPKPDHEPAGFTVLNFPVEDIEAAIDALAERGVEMLRYDGIPLDERGIMREGGPLIAWFTGPAGNVLPVLEDG